MNMVRLEHFGSCLVTRRQKSSMVEQVEGLWLLGPSRGQQRAKEQKLTARKKVFLRLSMGQAILQAGGQLQ